MGRGDSRRTVLTGHLLTSSHPNGTEEELGGLCSGSSSVTLPVRTWVNLPSSLGPGSFIYKTISSRSSPALSPAEANSRGTGPWTRARRCPIMSQGTMSRRRAGSVRKGMAIPEQPSGQSPCHQPMPALPSARIICGKSQGIKSLSSLLRVYSS